LIRKGRLPGERFPEGYVRIAPDLAVEVISPNDLAYEVDDKVEEYLRAGVRLVWVVNPQTRTVRIHRADGSIAQRREGEDLTGDDVLPGFVCPLAAVFPPTAPAPTPPTAEPKG
jgi:Uma2 family endonuclease